MSTTWRTLRVQWDSVWRVAAVGLLAVSLAACSGGGTQEPLAHEPLKVVTANPAPFTGHGTWWNPAEPGSGFVFEAQGATGVITYFTYEASGKPVWYTGPGAFTRRSDGKFIFEGNLFRYSGGQSAASTTPKTPSRSEIGPISIVFDGDAAQVQVPGRSFQARKFNATTTASATQPEAGIYWNPGESGRGYTIEVANNVASIGVFHYDAAGEPTWNLVVGDLASGKLVSPFTSYSGGQTLGGAYRAPQAVATTQQFQADFSQACRGSIQFPGMGSTAVIRFAFGGLPTGAECRATATPPPPTPSACMPSVTSGYAQDVATTPADSGGDGSSGGSGGGAAAGGGLGKVLAGLLTLTDLSDGTVIGSAVTDGRDGLVTVKTCARTGPFQLTLEGRPGALYFDEGLNLMKEFESGNALHALVDKWDEHVGVSPLTEAAYRYALNNFKGSVADIAAGRAPLRATGSLVGITADQVRAANRQVTGEVNARLTSGYQLASGKTLPTPIDALSRASALPNTAQGITAAVVGGLVKSARDYNAALRAPALSLTDQLARDLTDGRLDGFGLDGLAASTAVASGYETIRLPLGAQIGVHAISKRFGAATVAPASLQLNEQAYFGSSDSANYSCASFVDSVGLLSDGSVTVLRRMPTPAGGVCTISSPLQPERQQRNFLTGVRQLMASRHFALAVMDDGSVRGWGANTCGALGGRLAEGLHPTPQVIAGLTDITSLAASTNVFGTRVLARDKTGRVFQMGVARFGTGTSVANQAECNPGGGLSAAKFVDPELIPSLSNVQKVFAGNSSYLALLADGRVMGWGSSATGLLGNATSAAGVVTFLSLEVPSSAPIEVPAIAGARDIVLYGLTGIALIRDGTVKVWGHGGGANLLPTSIAQPTTFAGIGDAEQMVGDFENNRIRILRRDGKVYVWGDWISSTQRQLTPRLETPAEAIRTITLQGTSAVFFRSGRVAFDHTSTSDVTPSYR